MEAACGKLAKKASELVVYCVVLVQPFRGLRCSGGHQHADTSGWYDDKKIHIAAPLVGTTVAKEFKDGGLAAGRVKKIEEGITYVTYDDGDKEEFINNLEEEMADLKQAVFDGLPQLQTPVKQAGRPTEGRPKVPNSASFAPWEKEQLRKNTCKACTTVLKTNDIKFTYTYQKSIAKAEQNPA